MRQISEGGLSNYYAKGILLGLKSTTIKNTGSHCLGSFSLSTSGHTFVIQKKKSRKKGDERKQKERRKEEGRKKRKMLFMFAYSLATGIFFRKMIK